MVVKRERLFREREAEEKAAELLKKKKKRKSSHMFRRTEDVLIPSTIVQDRSRPVSE